MKIEINSIENLPEGFVITDSNVFENYKHLIGERGFVIQAGERSKSVEIYLEIVNKLENTNRIIAFGGGVVGDLAGFIASTYKRGIKLIQIPTSLLAMVDSSIGGKNGINLGQHKNYLGTICQPDKILIDFSFLRSLPEKEFKNGVAEIIKYGILFGKPTLERLERGINLNDSDLQEIILQCIENKLEVVDQDEKDLGYRHILNFGHTIGHAIELFYNLSHGQAISIGMVKELELQGRKEDAEYLKKILKINNLPTEFPDNFNSEKVLEIIKQDKKGELVFAFDKENYKVVVSEENVRRILK